MESPLEPEKLVPEPRWIRPPGLELLMGLSIFALLFGVYFGAQLGFFIYEVVRHTPELAAQTFSIHMLDDDAFKQSSTELFYNGDVVTRVTIAADGFCLVILLLVVGLWKRSNLVTFLGLRPPMFKPFAAWLGLFVLVFCALEGLGQLFPDLDSETMKRIIGSTTNLPLAFIGLALMPAIFEELLLRGLLFGSLRHMLHKHYAVAITAGVFAMMHMQYAWYIQVLLVLPLGVFLGYSRANTGSVWTSVTMHMLNNAVAVLVPQLI